MAVKIRMTRMGSNKKPFFRIVVADVKRKINGQYLEIVGWYDPKKKSDNFELKLDRVNYWIGAGAEPSDSVNSLIRKLRKAQPAAAPAPAAS
jgi:small subunit ribosomal protein S16